MHFTRHAIFGCVSICVAGLIGCAGMMAQDHDSAGHGQMAIHIVIPPDQIKWGPGPAGLPAGAMMSVLAGDPGKPGIFTLRAKLPAGYTVPPHWHSSAENVTVISGAFNIGDGDILDKARSTKLAVGGFTSMPPRMHHFAFADQETVIQVHGMGPFDITYINPADDPRK